MNPAQTLRIVYWEEDGGWIGHLQDYPDYWSQGDSLDDLREHLKDLYRDIASGQIPAIRRVEESNFRQRSANAGVVLLRH